MSISPNAKLDEPVVELVSAKLDPSENEGLSLKQTIFNAVAFQAAWFDLLVFQSGVAVVFIAILAWQLSAVLRQGLRSVLLPLMLVLTIGLTLDSLLSFVGLYQFGETALVAGLIPQWLILVWIAFTLTLPISFAWMMNKVSLAVGVFACLAPLSYLAGRHLGVIEFSNWVVPLIALAWAIVGYASSRLLQKNSLGRDELNSKANE